jgi:hypothetical protein
LAHNAQKTYLGDSVYAQHREDDAILITIEDGISVSEQIVLEFEVYQALVQYACRVWPGGD